MFDYKQDVKRGVRGACRSAFNVEAIHNRVYSLVHVAGKPRPRELAVEGFVEAFVVRPVPLTKQTSFYDHILVPERALGSNAGVCWARRILATRIAVHGCCDRGGTVLANLFCVMGLPN